MLSLLLYRFLFPFRFLFRFRFLFLFLFPFLFRIPDSRFSRRPCMTRMARWLGSHDSLARWLAVCQGPSELHTVMYRRCKRILKGSVTALLLSGSLLVIFFIAMEKHCSITLRTQPDDIVAKDATALNVHSTCSTGG